MFVTIICILLVRQHEISSVSFSTSAFLLNLLILVSFFTVQETDHSVFGEIIDFLSSSAFLPLSPSSVSASSPLHLTCQMFSSSEWTEKRARDTGRLAELSRYEELISDLKARSITFLCLQPVRPSFIQTPNPSNRPSLFESKIF